MSSVNIRLFTLAWFLLCLDTSLALSRVVLIEAESFSDRGGWVIDQQSMDHMGSPYLMAHGLGQPVADASTTIEFEQLGTYFVWVRTRDWVGPWKSPETKPGMRAEGSPGRFNLLIDENMLEAELGVEGNQWHWQDCGPVTIKQNKLTLTLRDQTGFNGRCDAIVFTTDQSFEPPNDLDELSSFRREAAGLTKTPADGGHYDLVVVGGGIAGICTAISAARADCRVALIQNRPLLGGNNSSEVRVGLSGLIRHQPYPQLGNLVDEISPVGHWTIWDAKKFPEWPRSSEVLRTVAKHPEKSIHNAGPASNYDDDRKLNAVLAEKNIRLFLYNHVNRR